MLYENYTVEMQTPAGAIREIVAVPTGFIPISEIVPLMRNLGGQAQKLEIDKVENAGAAISCQKGCAACCRMMIPTSPPEAVLIRAHIDSLEPQQRSMIRSRMQATQRRLQQAGLDGSLKELAFSPTQVTDAHLEPLNQAYYDLQIPCPFLEDDVCSIYEQRPSACRELLVTSPPEWCRNFAKQPVAAISMPFRMSTILSHLWAGYQGGPIRLIPLPYILDWGRQSESMTQTTMPGPKLLQRALEMMATFLHRSSS